MTLHEDGLKDLQRLWQCFKCCMNLHYHLECSTVLLFTAYKFYTLFINSVDGVNPQHC